MKKIFSVIFALSLTFPLCGMFQPNTEQDGEGTAKSGSLVNSETDFQLLIEQALVHVKNKENYRAVTPLMQVAKGDHDSSRKAAAFYALGNIYVQQFNGQKAKKYLKQALDPDNNPLIYAHACFSLGELYDGESKYLEHAFEWYDFGDGASQLRDEIMAKRDAGRIEKSKAKARYFFTLAANQNTHEPIKHFAYKWLSADQQQKAKSEQAAQLLAGLAQAQEPQLKKQRPAAKKDENIY